MLADEPRSAADDASSVAPDVSCGSEEQQRLNTTPVAERSDLEIKRFIEGNSLVWRFCLYGAIKNLQFFEAYLLLILLEWGYSLFQIGILSAVTHSLTYLFEVPSGVIADHFGKKNELMVCFVFYIISFGLYAFGESSFTILVFASVFYGLGEAFRSGTHKAMIMVWLDRQKLSQYKTFIYSRTRSFSNIGSALNAVLSVLIIVLLDNYQLGAEPVALLHLHATAVAAGECTARGLRSRAPRPTRS
jgi:MFS family permease